MKEINLNVKGMQCVSCEMLISNSLNELKSVSAKANFEKGSVCIRYNENQITLSQIEKVINNEGFKVAKEKEDSKLDGVTILKYLIIFISINYIFTTLTNINILLMAYNMVNSLVSNVPVVTEDTSLFIIFLVGALTSVHCVAMCGGINVAQCMTFRGQSNASPNIMYNLGRVTSYTVLGGIVGLVGSVLTLTIKMQGLLYILVGFFMVLMSINLYGINFGRKLLPKMPKKFRTLNNKGNAPFVVGLLNGLMPCGPLQSMQLYALSTGSFYQGALSMFLFSVGTVPLMYIFGKIGEFKKPSVAKTFIKVSAVLVLILGFIMANRGLSLLGVSMPSLETSSTELSSTIEGDTQVIYTELSPRSYPDLVVKKGVKVKWVINATQSTLNGCNNEIIINEYGISKKLEIGENIIEFTPTETGKFGYSCWMGMIRAKITVVE